MVNAPINAIMMPNIEYNESLSLLQIISVVLFFVQFEFADGFGNRNDGWDIRTTP